MVSEVPSEIEGLSRAIPVGSPRQTRLQPQNRLCSNFQEAEFESESSLTRPNSYIFMNETSNVSDNKFYIYILYSKYDKGLYIGYTTDLKKRLIKHAKGRVRSTKLRAPFKLIHYEYFINIKDAKSREKFLKSGYGRKQLQEILKRTFEILV